MGTYGLVRYDKKAKCYYLQLWLNGKRHRLYRLPLKDGEMVPCKVDEMAKALQWIVSRQIDQGLFRPERFKVKRPMHMKAYAEAWFKKQTHLGAATARDYRTYLDKYIIPHLGAEFIQDITEATLDDFVKWMPHGPKYKQNVLGCCMKILHDAERARDIDRAPMKPVMRGSDTVVDPEVVWLEPTEQDKILAELKQRYRPLILFGMMTGVRPSEARALRWEDVLQSRGEIVIRHTFDIKGNLVPVKGKKSLPIPITDELKELLDLMPKSITGFVFINQATGQPFGRNITKVFARACKKALGYSIGIAKATRTSFAQQLANADIEINMVSRWLRHSDTKVTKRYYEFKTSSMKSAIDKVRPLKRNRQ